MRKDLRCRRTFCARNPTSHCLQGTWSLWGHCKVPGLRCLCCRVRLAWGLGRASDDHLRHEGFNHSQRGPSSLHEVLHPALPVPCECPRAGLPGLSRWPLLTRHPNTLPGPLQPPSTTLGPPGTDLVSKGARKDGPRGGARDQ